MSAMKQAAKSKTCKCLTGWKKSVNKATGKSECNKVTYAIFNARLKEVGVSSKLFVATGKDHGWRHPVVGELKVFLDWFDDNLLDK